MHAARHSKLSTVFRWNASDWVFPTNHASANSTNSTLGASVARAASALSQLQGPVGFARLAFYCAMMLVVLRWFLLRRATRRAVAEYGHAQ